MSASPVIPKRLLIVCPSWLGDVVMATPALRRIRSALPGAFIGALLRPGLDELLAGSDFFDELHVDRARGVMGPKLVAAKIRPRRYDAALLLTNSFSTALITRLAFIPRRVGYARDARGLLLTDKLRAPRRARPHRGWMPIPAIDYYLHAADVLLPRGAPEPSPPLPHLHLAVTTDQDTAALDILRRARVLNPADDPSAPLAILNPGGNNPAKRWPADRFAQIALHLLRRRGMHVLLSGAPAERDLTQSILEQINSASFPSHLVAADISTLGVTIGSLKGVVRHASLMVTNDTGPRHIAAAFHIPTIALFGPTDHRWTTLPDSSPNPGTRERLILSDPSLPPDEVADDHPERCRIDRIQTAAVIDAIDAMPTRP
ncbi:MAG: glycosyltransferase family 9 protein [Phycisphaerales bacterium]